jgi:hypothetical protein
MRNYNFFWAFCYFVLIRPVLVLAVMVLNGIGYLTRFIGDLFCTMALALGPRMSWREAREVVRRRPGDAELNRILDEQFRSVE